MRIPLQLWCAAVSAAAASTLLACGGDSSRHEPEAADVWIEIGTAGGNDDLDFVPLEPGGELPLHTFGQGGTHALLAVRCSGFGRRAFVGISLTSAMTGRQVTSPPSAEPSLLLCRDDAETVCDLLPIFVMTGALVGPEASSAGVPIVVRADAHHRDGLSASVERQAILVEPSL